MWVINKFLKKDKIDSGQVTKEEAIKSAGKPPKSNRSKYKNQRTKK